jgi:hypothetical protein
MTTANVPIYLEPGGASLVIGAGGKITAEAGAYSSGLPQVAYHNVTTAEVNAGHVVLPAISGKTYTIWSVKACARGGAATTVTSIDVTDTAPVTAATFAVAQLTAEKWCDHCTTACTGAKIGTPLTADKGVKVIKNGADMTVATSVDVVILYTLS